MILLVNSAAHFLVDGLCLAALTAMTNEDRAQLIMLYDTLAFSTQCIVGLLIDRIRRYGLINACAMLLAALAYILPLPDLLRVILIGTANSFFHVAAGTETIVRSRGKAGDLGLFVAPGALGVTLGKLYPQIGIWLAFALAAAAGWTLFRYLHEDKKYGSIRPEPVPERDFPTAAVALLTAAVAVRAIGGMAVTFPWKEGAAAAIILTVSVFAGKALGGLVCDRLGAVRTAWITIPAAAVLIAFCSGHMLPSLAGQFLLNLTMPLTLYLLYRLMPDQPGFAFGLAAAALWPGTLIGKMFRLTGPALWACVIISFIFGLAAVLYSVHVLKKRREQV